VDRYFILPQADPIPSTTYLDADNREALSKGSKDGKLEYLQGNLLTDGELYCAATGAVRAAVKRRRPVNRLDKWGARARRWLSGLLEGAARLQNNENVLESYSKLALQLQSPNPSVLS
jgi:hypothetical protein